MKKGKKVMILDTTMRDGEQTPGVSLTPQQKLLIARKLDEVGVDVIEGGTAVSSRGESEALKLMAKEKLSAEVASFARVLRKDIDAVLETGVSTVCLTVSTSDLHIEKKLKKTRVEVLAMAVDCVEYAKKHGLIVDLLAEDGSRTDWDYLKKIFSEGIKAGADRVTVCDTVGVLCPEKSYELFQFLSKEVKVPLGVHCHNDLGLAVANSLAGVRGGAKEVHVTVNGMGERTGNAPLEEVALDLKFFYGIDTIKIEKLYDLSTLVEGLARFPLSFNKPLVGKHAFMHESGIHVDGMLKEERTYEPITPEMIGRKRKFILGKHSGAKAVKMKLEELGVKVTDAQFSKIVDTVKDIGDKGKTVTDADFQVVVFDILGQKKERAIQLKEFVVVTGNSITPTASVKLNIRGEEKSAAGLGNGPVDAAVAAIENMLGKTEFSLQEYHVDAITGGTNALVDVRVVLKKGNKEVSASAASTDIVMASVEAMLRALELLL